MSNPEFFQALLELEIPIKANGEPWNHSEEDIYLRIVPSLQGKRDYEFEEKSDFITAQRSGSCSWKSWMQLLHLESESLFEYKKSSFELGFDSLIAYSKKIEEQTLPLNDERVQLFERCAGTFIRYALNLHKEGIISAKELKEVEALITTKVNNIKFKWRQADKGVPPKILDYGHQYSFSNTFIPNKLLMDFTPEVLDVEAIHFSIEIVSQSSFEKPPKNLSTLNEKLSALVTICRDMQVKAQPTTVVKCIQELLRTLSTEKLEKGGYWDKICSGQPSEEIERTMTYFMELNQLLFSTISSLPVKEKASPEIRAMMGILLTVNFKLSQTLDITANPFNTNEWGIDNELMNLWDVNIYTIIRDPAIRSLFEESRSFLKENKNQNPYQKNLFELNSASLNQLSIKFDDSESLSSPSSDIKFCQSLEYLIKTPTFRQNPRFSWLKVASEKKIVKTILPHLWNLKRGLFPKSYQILFQQSMLLNYLERNPNFNQLPPGQTVGRFSTKWVSESSKKIGFQIVFPSVDIDFSSSENVDSNDQFRANYFLRSHTPFKRPGFESILTFLANKADSLKAST